MSTVMSNTCITADILRVWYDAVLLLMAGSWDE